MKTRKGHLILWIVISMALLGLMVLHPRINHGILLCCGIIQCIQMAVSKKEWKVKTLWLNTIGMLLCLVIVWDMTKWLDIFYPYHAPYEYKQDIQRLKSGYRGQCFTQFPDEIPADAFKVKWVCMPSLMQARGHEALFFYADKEYLSKVYDTYALSADIYTYKENDFQIDSGERTERSRNRSIWFPIVNDMTNEEKKNVEVLILCEYSYYNGGLYINQQEGYICFFVDICD